MATMIRPVLFISSIIGMNEGRIAKASFDVTSYRLQYSDLRRAYGNNLKSYYLHYLQWGRQEGRKGSGCIRLQGAITTLNGTDYGRFMVINTI